MIGKLIYPMMSKFRKIAYSNISHCFPEKKQPQVTILVKKHFESIGISLFETANAYYASDKKINKMLTINNEQHFTEALKKEGGIILLCSHFMPLMLGTIIIFICGIGYLSSIIGFEKAIAVGLLPFIPSELFKIALAVFIIPTIWKYIQK